MKHKVLKVASNTHYYHNQVTRKYNYVPNSYSYSFARQRNFELYVRAYSEYHQTTLDGFTSFFTLTYNDYALPLFLGIPCFSSTHINKLLHALRNRLKRKYNVSFNYLVTKEYGSKKDRPHYHFLVFVHNTKGRFTHRMLAEHVAELWQGTSLFGFHDYKRMKYGHVDDGGEIRSHAGIQYVVKYALKDTSTKRFEYKVYKAICDHVKSCYTTSDYISLMEEFISDNEDYIYDKLSSLGIVQRRLDLLCIDEEMQFYKFLHNDVKFQRWLLSREEIQSNLVYSDYLKYFSNKPQKSNELGLCALDFGNVNKLDGTIALWIGNKVKVFPLPLYLYRKVFYEPPFIDPYTGNVKYILNYDGIQHKLRNMENYIRNAKNYFCAATSYLKDNEDLFLKSFPEYHEVPSISSIDVSRIIKFHLVYSGRFYNPANHELDLIVDYNHSLQSLYLVEPFREVPYARSCEALGFGLIPYEDHPEFSDLPDKITQYFDIINFYFNNEDILAEEKDSLYKRIKQNHNEKRNL